MADHKLSQLSKHRLFIQFRRHPLYCLVSIHKLVIYRTSVSCFHWTKALIVHCKAYVNSSLKVIQSQDSGVLFWIKHSFLNWSQIRSSWSHFVTQKQDCKVDVSTLLSFSFFEKQNQRLYFAFHFWRIVHSFNFQKQYKQNFLSFSRGHNYRFQTTALFLHVHEKGILFCSANGLSVNCEY